LARKGGGGFDPVDAPRGLTGDGCSPFVLRGVTRLATRVRCSASVRLLRCVYGWAPSREAVQQLPIGMGTERGVSMEHAHAPPDDGDILLIAVDGQATPTATADARPKRRGTRHPNPHACGCVRHRGQAKRACRGKKQRRQPGEKSQNGRRSTLVVMDTLQRGDDGRRHGPLNTHVWGSDAPRKVLLAWARRHATTRGFPPGTDQRIPLVLDGETCLHDGLAVLCPQATFALDIRHGEERRWQGGRVLDGPDPDAVAHGVEEPRAWLSTGLAAPRVTGCKALKLTVSARAKRDAATRARRSDLIGSLAQRLAMMASQDLSEADRVIASGLVEGAARSGVGERLDWSGMGWRPERAEAVRPLRCLERNGEWERCFAWGSQRWLDHLRAGQRVMIRTDQAEALPTAESMEATETQAHQDANPPIAA